METNKLEILSTENTTLQKTIDDLEKLKKEVTDSLNNLYKYEKNSDTLSIFSDMYTRTLKNLNKNLYSPYFAKIKYKDNNEKKIETLYIGKVGFASLDGEEEYIVDWRAPISQLYYNGKVGECSYSSLNQTFYGTMSLKRQFDIKDKQIIDFFDHEDLISNDEFLRPYLTTNADNRLKSIVSTIQSEQDNIIRQPMYKNIIIQGVAGSGKTTVALHRLSYLVYTYEKKIKTNEYLILAPSKIFLKYISSILPDLDVGEAKESTVEDFVKLVSNIPATILNKHSVYNYLLEKNEDYNFLYYKSSLKFKLALDSFLESYIQNNILKPVVIKNVELLNRKEVEDIFHSTNNYLDLTTRIEIMCKILSNKLQTPQYLNKINNAYKNDAISFSDKNKLITEIEKGYYSKLCKYFLKKPFDILKTYKTFIISIEKHSNENYLPLLKEVTLHNLKNNLVGFEDIGAILYLTYKLINTRYLKFKHIFIDEAQDLGELLLFSLHKIFNDSYFSIFGDLTQGIYEFQGVNNWENVITSCFNNEASLIEMNKSYRTTIEIMNEANCLSKLLGFSPANNVLRHGNDVKYINILDHKKDLLSAISFLSSMCSSIALICKNDAELRQCQILLQDSDVKMYSENDNCDIYNLCMLTVQTSKGLEFDGVIIFDKNSYDLTNSLDIKCLYVAETRALHNLIILNSNKN